MLPVSLSLPLVPVPYAVLPLPALPYPYTPVPLLFPPIPAFDPLLPPGVEPEVEPPGVEPEVEPPGVEPEVEPPGVEPPGVEPEVEPPGVEPEVEPPGVEPEVEPLANPGVDPELPPSGVFPLLELDPPGTVPPLDPGWPPQPTSTSIQSSPPSSTMVSELDLPEFEPLGTAPSGSPASANPAVPPQLQSCTLLGFLGLSQYQAFFEPQLDADATRGIFTYFPAWFVKRTDMKSRLYVNPWWPEGSSRTPAWKPEDTLTRDAPQTCCLTPLSNARTPCSVCAARHACSADVVSEPVVSRYPLPHPRHRETTLRDRRAPDRKQLPILHLQKRRCTRQHNRTAGPSVPENPLSMGMGPSCHCGEPTRLVRPR